MAIHPKTLLFKKLPLCVGLLAFLISNTSGLCATTELLIKAQDDQPEGRIIKITIPDKIEDGPVGRGLIVIDECKSAITDLDGNFLAYPYDENRKIAPRLLINSNNGDIAYVKDLNQEQSVRLKIERDHNGINYIRYNNLTYDLSPPSQRYPYLLTPLDEHGGPLPFAAINQTNFFNTVSTFGIVWSVMDMYEKDIKNLGILSAKSKWANKGNIRIFPHMSQQQFEVLYPGLKYEEFYKNAFYDYRRQDRKAPHVLCFFPMSKGSEQYTSESFSVVSHETGHYVLDILRPELRQSTSSDRSALHETMGDMTAFFLTLKFSELRNRILNLTKGNLHHSSFLSVIGKNIADRDATSCSTLSIIPECEAHALSEKLTRAVYSTFADFFNVERGDKLTHLDSLLKEKSQEFRQVFLRATLKSDLTSYIDFGRSLRAEAGEGTRLQDLVHTNFLRQGIDLTDILLSPQICQRGIEPAAISCSTGRVRSLTQHADNADHLNSSMRQFHINKTNGRRY